ncbi:MAG: hypothetical protein JXR48_02845 [Candidatus Delongbacteria bacterium]|nr:hypothetical protein [Candidatus Delongbacteria bacterium]MBN2833885.1 hypothetical protein [Candidatus Delongbacteria bacterium]
MKKILALVFLIILSACDNESGLLTSDNQEKFLRIDEQNSEISSNVIAVSGDGIYNFKVIVDENYTPEYDIVFDGYIVTPDDSIIVNIFDDGGFNPNSNDMIALDGIYTGSAEYNNLFSQDGILELSYKILRKDGSTYLSNQMILDKDLAIFNVHQPELNSIEGLNDNQILESGFDEIVLNPIFTDEDLNTAISDDHALNLEIMSNNVLQKSINFGFIDQFSIDSTLTAGISSGNYDFIFTLTDSYGVNSNQHFYYNIYMENGLPNFESINIPEIFQLDTTIINTIIFEVKPGDPQGYEDIEKVSIYFEGSSFEYQLFDDGSFLGDIPNDNTYVMNLVLKPENIGPNTPGDYNYMIKIFDTSGSVELQKTITLQIEGSK